MATKMKRKPVSRETIRKAAADAKANAGKRKAVASAPVKAKTADGNGKFDAKQLPLVEDVDERVPALTDACQQFLSIREKRRSLKEDYDDQLGKIGELLKEHELECYIVNGKKFFIEPSSVIVKVKNVKQQ